MRSPGIAHKAGHGPSTAESDRGRNRGGYRTGGGTIYQLSISCGAAFTSQSLALGGSPCRGLVTLPAESQSHRIIWLHVLRPDGFCPNTLTQFAVRSFSCSREIVPAP